MVQIQDTLILNQQLPSKLLGKFQKEQESFNSACISIQKAEIEWKVNNGYHVSSYDINYYKYK